MSGRRPLEGVKVLELGQLIAGPFAGKFFAEFGAEVIKIEPPEGGDPLRQWRKLHEGTSLWWYVQNRAKKSVTVNLRLPEGQEIVRRLAREADLLIRETELKAERLLEDAHRKLGQVQAEIAELKRQRDLFASKLRGLLKIHMELLDAEPEKPAPQA